MRQVAGGLGIISGLPQEEAGWMLEIVWHPRDSHGQPQHTLPGSGAPSHVTNGAWPFLVARVFSEQSRCHVKGNSLEPRALMLAGPDFLHLLVHRELLDAALPRKPVCMHTHEL